MSKKIYYRYNPSTDSYERVFPSRRKRIFTALGHFLVSIILGGSVFFMLSGIIDMPKERLLRNDNEELRTQLKIIDARLENAREVMEHLAERDNNFYRVMMQADPITSAERFSGLERHTGYEALSSMADNQLVGNLLDRVNLLEREIVVQSRSYDSLRNMAVSRKDRLNHIPAIQPVSEKHLKQMASGYGYRVDPIYGTAKFHEGMDFASNIGTPVYATGNGIVKFA